MLSITTSLEFAFYQIHNVIIGNCREFYAQRKKSIIIPLKYTHKHKIFSLFGILIIAPFFAFVNTILNKLHIFLLFLLKRGKIWCIIKVYIYGTLFCVLI